MTDRKNMSVMELAYQILFENERSMTFNELFEAICKEKGIDEQSKAEMTSQVYTDFISSAKFIYVGDDEWDVKGRRAIDLWDKDGAYYDEYPDYEEELTLFEDEKDEYSIDSDVKVEDEEEEEESIYEDDFDEDDIEDDDSDYDEFEEDEEEYEEEADLDFEEDLDEEDIDELEVEEEAPAEEIFEEEEEFEEEEYNEYMDDYENMYED